MKKAGYILYLVIITLVAAEILLRIYNPFTASVRGDDIILPVNHSMNIRNDDQVNGLDRQIVVHYNELGFRGDPLPKDTGVLRIMAIGGSTTECRYISDGNTWEDVLQDKLKDSLPNLWINNAGLDGHSTFGHLLLLKKHVLQLKPDVCLFLTGANDIGRTDLDRFDSSLVRIPQQRLAKVARYSRLAALGLNLYRHRRAKSFQLPHALSFSLLNHDSCSIADTVVAAALQQHTATAQQYRERLKEIIGLCRNNNTEPVFITQPCLLGEGLDDSTGVDLATFCITPGMNGRLLWQVLELYNQQTRDIAAANNVFLIDLAHLLPKSSRYFYDTWHYNNEGCKKIGEIMAAELNPFLKLKMGN